MKTISGRVIDSKPISLSKAASVLSNFVSTHNGASHAVRAYLRRASASFDELLQLHKYSSRSGSKQERHKSEAVEENPTQSFDLTQEPSQSDRRQRKHRSEVTGLGREPSGGVGDREGVENENKRHKKKKRKEKVETGDVEDNGGLVRERESGGGMENVKEKGKEKKIKAEEGGLADSGSEPSKKKKKDRTQFNNGVKVEEREGEAKMEREEMKKRKSGEVENGGMDDSEERRSKKTKRRKTES